VKKWTTQDGIHGPALAEAIHRLQDERDHGNALSSPGSDSLPDSKPTHQAKIAPEADTRKESRRLEQSDSERDDKKTKVSRSDDHFDKSEEHASKLEEHSDKTEKHPDRSEEHDKAEEHSDKAEKHASKAEEHADKQAEKHSDKVDKHADKVDKHASKAERSDTSTAVVPANTSSVTITDADVPAGSAEQVSDQDSAGGAEISDSTVSVSSDQQQDTPSESSDHASRSQRSETPKEVVLTSSADAGSLVAAVVSSSSDEMGPNSPRTGAAAAAVSGPADSRQVPISPYGAAWSGFVLPTSTHALAQTFAVGDATASIQGREVVPPPLDTPAVPQPVPAGLEVLAPAWAAGLNQSEGNPRGADLINDLLFSPAAAVEEAGAVTLAMEQVADWLNTDTVRSALPWLTAAAAALVASEVARRQLLSSARHQDETARRADFYPAGLGRG